ncbi:hypothetical protein PLICRDRAFT_376006 [Plicaturopsis crispa FD-325 SS-3]|nr:hypothetical protein PLICRDRAFT_376006 [Plicaturopsis crispa FD-325 SS-3]
MVKEVLVVGFGAVGAIYSLILKRSGLARVTAVARSNYSAVDATGMHFKSRKYGDIPGWKPDRLVKSVAEAADRQYSFVVVTTKAIPEVSSTPGLLAPFLTRPYTTTFAQPAYVLFQNGLNVEKDLYEALEKVGDKNEMPKIISTSLFIGTNLLDDNVVEHNDFDRVSMGLYRKGDYTTTTNSPAEASLLSEFGELLETGGTTLTIVPEIQRLKFAKNFWNLSFSSLATLTGYTLPAIFRPPPSDGASYEPYVSPATKHLIEEHTIPALRAILGEFLAVGRAVGFPDSPDGLPFSLIDSTIAMTRKLHELPESTHVPSMLLDMRKGRPIEVEVIVGEVVRLAKEQGVAVPRIEMLYALLLVVQNQTLRKLESTKS